MLRGPGTEVRGPQLATCTTQQPECCHMHKLFSTQTVNESRNRFSFTILFGMAAITSARAATVRRCLLLSMRHTPLQAATALVYDSTRVLASRCISSTPFYLKPKKGMCALKWESRARQFGISWNILRQIASSSQRCGFIRCFRATSRGALIREVRTSC